MDNQIPNFDSISSTDPLEIILAKAQEILDYYEKNKIGNPDAQYVIFHKDDVLYIKFPKPTDLKQIPIKVVATFVRALIMVANNMFQEAKEKESAQGKVPAQETIPIPTTKTIH